MKKKIFLPTCSFRKRHSGHIEIFQLTDLNFFRFIYLLHLLPSHDTARFISNWFEKLLKNEGGINSLFFPQSNILSIYPSRACRF